jgi:hypothetical protein
LETSLPKSGSVQLAKPLIPKNVSEESLGDLESFRQPAESLEAGNQIYQRMDYKRTVSFSISQEFDKYFSMLM